MRPPNRPRARRWALALATSSLLAACGSSGQRVAPAYAPDALGVAEPAQLVQAGSYRLSMSASCESTEKTATGTLTLRRIDDGLGAAEGASDATLLWGQMNLDFAELASCLAPSAPSSEEPIHPSVLVEVLHWDGGSGQQVLLVSADSSASAGPLTGVGVAMWVERVEHGHLAGVWSRWELMGRGEGSWEAELLSAP